MFAKHTNQTIHYSFTFIVHYAISFSFRTHWVGRKNCLEKFAVHSFFCCTIVFMWNQMLENRLRFPSPFFFAAVQNNDVVLYYSAHLLMSWAQTTRLREQEGLEKTYEKCFRRKLNGRRKKSGIIFPITVESSKWVFLADIYRRMSARVRNTRVFDKEIISMTRVCNVKEAFGKKKTSMKNISTFYGESGDEVVPT